MARSKGQKSRSERSHRESATGRNPAKTLGLKRQKAPTCVGALSYWRWTQSAANLYRACSRFGRSFSCSEIYGERWVHLVGHPLKNKHARTSARAKKGLRTRTLQAPTLLFDLPGPALFGQELMPAGHPPSPRPAEAAGCPRPLPATRCRCSSCARGIAQLSASIGCSPLPSS